MSIEQISFVIYFDENLHQSSRDDNHKFLSLNINRIQGLFKQPSLNHGNGLFQIENLQGNHLQNNSIFPKIEKIELIFSKKNFFSYALAID